MTPDSDTCFRAMKARDRRFDGVFFVGVTTTGVYCRPICPARTPGRDRCRFFERAAEADCAGFRACFRCRPELAPGNASVDSLSRLARAAQARIDAGFLNGSSASDLARDLGVTSRHLRRALGSELGVSPLDLAQARRLALAKQLLHDTGIAMSDVAFASGFSSVRRFNAAFAAHFGRAPSAMRRNHAVGDGDGAIALRLDYRPPLDWRSLLEFLGERAIPGVEQVDRGELKRSVTLGNERGWISVRADVSRPCLHARVSISLAARLMEVVVRLRALFDLDAHPEAIAAQLSSDALLARLVRAHPGLRVPGAFDPFETSVRAILGQQVSVRGATTLAGRFAERFGTRDGSLLFFPSASVIARRSAKDVRAIGLPASRAETIVELARALDQHHLDLSGATPHEQAIERLLEIPGVGPWTASYVAMRALKWPDAFPAGDLGVRKALSVDRASEAEARAKPWRPWRAYAVMHLWSSLAKGG